MKTYERKIYFQYGCWVGVLVREDGTMPGEDSGFHSAFLSLQQYNESKTVSKTAHGKRLTESSRRLFYGHPPPSLRVEGFWSCHMCSQHINHSGSVWTFVGSCPFFTSVNFGPFPLEYSSDCGQSPVRPLGFSLTT